MDTSSLLAIAREIVDKVTFCFAVTVGTNQETSVRIIEPGKPRDDWSVGFMTTRNSRKVVDLERSGRLTLAYQWDPDKAYVSLAGQPLVIDDVAAKRAVWGPASDRWHPEGPEDPNVVIVKLLTDRIEVWSAAHNVMPPPKGFNAAVLIRDGSGWRYSETFQPS